MQTEATRESRVRRLARRQGLALQKSRRRDPRCLDYGCYRLVHPYLNCLVFGGAGVYLADVEEFLAP